jgi:hypothetical protein
VRAVSPPAQLQQLPPAQLQQLHAASASAERRPAPRVDSSLCRGAAVSQIGNLAWGRNSVRPEFCGVGLLALEVAATATRWAPI